MPSIANGLQSNLVVCIPTWPSINESNEKVPSGCIGNNREEGGRERGIYILNRHSVPLVGM